MVLVDFTLIERWRIFGEVSLRSVPRTTQAERTTTQATTVTATEAPRVTRYASNIDPQESAARRQSEAALMQRLL
jgi:hypothetical protein